VKLLYAPVAQVRPNRQGSEKNYPWPQELADLLKKDGHEVIQVGAAGEKQYADRFYSNPDWKKLIQLLSDADTFISVDTFLQHMAWLLWKRGIVIFSQTDPMIFGHPELHICLLKDRKYLRPGVRQFDTFEGLECNDEAFITPYEVVTTLALIKPVSWSVVPEPDAFHQATGR
jgi:ADP-heptose:LPS heptosyltransferase